jgi:hypothetical protein
MAGDDTSRKVAGRKTVQLAAALHEKCGPIAFNFTVPIFRETESKAINFGSGVLVDIDSKPVLLTAGHVLDEILNSSEVIGVSTGERGTQGVQLLYGRYVTNIPPGTKRSADDYLDAGVLLLRKDVAEALAGRFVTQKLLETNDDELEGNLYLVLGFSSSRKKTNWFKQTAQAEATSYATSVYRLSRGKPKDYSPSTEILIDYSKRHNFSPSLQKVMAPDPVGMSGCGIWRMFTPGSRNATSPEHAMRLVGISHTWCKKLGIIRGTRVSVFLEMIRQMLQ